MHPRFVIVGTGRSGSGYISRVLTAAGIRCGHEEWWNPTNVRTPDLVGDSSWCAVPALPAIVDRGVIVLHQVRHPLKVVSSFAKKWNRRDEYWPLKASTILRPLTGDDLVDGMACYVDANRACEPYTSMRWQLEQIDDQLLRHISTCVGSPISVRQARAALENVPTNYNQHVTGTDLDWGDLPDIPLKQELRDLGRSYGYAC